MKIPHIPKEVDMRITLKEWRSRFPSDSVRTEGIYTICSDTEGNVDYFYKGHLHREDGPARIRPHAVIPSLYCWALDGTVHKEQDWKEEMYKINLQKIVE